MAQRFQPLLTQPPPHHHPLQSRSFPSPGLLADLHESVARMVAFTVLNLTMWAMSLAWFVIDGCERNTVYYACNFGFLLSAIVAGLAGGLWRVSKSRKR